MRRTSARDRWIAQKSISHAYGLKDKITAVLSDGLKEVPVCGSGADGFIAAGMGGKLIVSILTAVPKKRRSLPGAVLSPQSEIWLVRQASDRARFFYHRRKHGAGRWESITQ